MVGNRLGLSVVGILCLLLEVSWQKELVPIVKNVALL